MRGYTRLRNLSAAVIATLALALTTFTAASPAHAWSSQDFNAGRIIDDSVFYDGNAMTAAEIQSFLDRRVPTCHIGRTISAYPGVVLRPGTLSPSGSGNTIADACLKDFRMTTQSRAADQYCNAYVGAQNETAAQIIAKVGKACSISQKVLLVMLEKEQSLVSDTWPVTRMYNYAMGMNCPDSGPNNSANCNSDSAGFFLQMILGARQLQVYKAHPNSFGYKPFQTNSIKWHPEDARGCGTSKVYIENWATAALYIYTPYRPNQAALKAGWGTGDHCSSYGNRNFFNFYNSWFGSTYAKPAVLGGIKDIWEQSKRNGFDFGDPLSSRSAVTTNGGGWQQEFANGVITESNALGRSYGLPSGMFSRAYLANGGASGPWGFLASEPRGVTSQGDRAVDTQHGTIIYTDHLGIQYLPSAIHKEWVRNGGFRGALGYPAAAAAYPSSSAASQLFSNGSTIMSAGNNATVVTASEQAVWQSLGGYDQVGHYVTSAVPYGGKSYRSTDKGIVFFSTSGPLYIANGQFLTAYFASDGPAGPWGWPLSTKQPQSGGVSSIEFEGGLAVHSPSYGVALLDLDTFGNPVPRLVDIAESIFAEEIVWMTNSAVATGYAIEFGAAEFRPHSSVTREAMAAFLYRLSGEPEFAAPAISPFIDVTTEHPFYKEIAWLQTTGITTGYDSAGNVSEFRPSTTVSREAMAAFLYRFAGSPSITMPSEIAFDDVSTDSLFFNAIAWLSQHGITTGYETSTGLEFRPRNPIAREAMAAFLYRSVNTWFNE